MMQAAFIQNFKGLLGDIASTCTNMLYPNVCPACETHLLSPSHILCPSCYRILERASPLDVAAVLATLPPHAPPLHEGFALWVFDKGGIIQTLQHQLKYQNRPFLGQKWGQMMGTYFAKMDEFRRITPDLVVPVPLAKIRHLERGYNQSAWIGKGLSETLGVPLHESLLTRVQHTRSQVTLNHDERWRNVASAFALHSPEKLEVELRGKHILLVDDVLTTGSTLAAASRPLFDAGAASVRCVTFAMAR